MKFLSICSYLCAAAAITLGVIVFQLLSEEREPLGAFILALLIIFLPGIMQFIYTNKTSGSQSLKEYKETKSLDDFMLNDVEITAEIVSNSIWLKIFSVVNSILLCFLFMAVSYAFRKIFIEVIDFDYTESEHFILLLVLILFLLSVPTVIYNIRTFNLKRVRA